MQHHCFRFFYSVRAVRCLSTRSTLDICMKRLWAGYVFSFLTSSVHGSVSFFFRLGGREGGGGGSFTHRRLGGFVYLHHLSDSETSSSFLSCVRSVYCTLFKFGAEYKTLSLSLYIYIYICININLYLLVLKVCYPFAGFHVFDKVVWL